MIFQGRCLCGKVTFEMTKEPNIVVNCHCSICRDSHGATFATQALFPPESYKVKEGKDNISQYESSTNFFRAFCKTCGAHIANYPKGKNFFSIPVNYLSGDLQPAMHIWTDSKAQWYNINDDLPQDEKMDKLMTKLQG